MKHISLKKSCFLLLCFLTLASTIAQNQKTIKNAYERYFDFRTEALHLHLNKSTYLVGEEIWFQAYLLDRKKVNISKESTNIFVGIYNANGIQLQEKLFHIKNGIVAGNIKITKEFPSGNYYLKASIQTKKGVLFNTDYIEKIVVLGTSVTNKKIAKNSRKTIDLQFLPESGHLLEGVKNRIGFKAIDTTGKGIKVKGIIKDQNHNTVAEFDSNHLGMGTFYLSPKTNTTYTATITQNTTLKFPLPKAQLRGFNLMVDAIENDSISIHIQTNKMTLKNEIGKEYSLLIHKDGTSKLISFLPKDMITTKVLAKNKLFNGINTITLFKGKTPIAERMFFNEHFVKKTAFIIKKASTTKDAVTLDFFMLKNKTKKEDAIVSISVLPELTKSYDHAHSSFSSIYLKPYLKGFIENPSYYFKNKTLKTRKNLDILLITQGWSAYDWTTIFNNTKKPTFTNGITLSGTVNYPTKNVKGIYIQQGEYKEAFYVSVDRDKKFVFPEFFPKDGENIKMAYANKNKEFFKPKVYMNYDIAISQDSIENRHIVAETNRKKEPIQLINTSFFTDDFESLDTVIIEGKKKEKKNHPDPLLLDLKEFDVDLDLVYRYPKVIDLIRHRGYNVSIDRVRGSRLKIITRKPMTGVKSREPYIFIDDVLLENFDFILDLSMANVKKMTISRNGYGYGLIDASAGVIKIYLREQPLTNDVVDNKNFLITRAPIGFSEAKEYYSPRYETLSTQNFINYGVIDWKANEHIPRAGKHSIKIPNTGTEYITLFIEGISKDGGLISQQKTIRVEALKN